MAARIRLGEVSYAKLSPHPAPPALDCWYLTGPTAAGKTQVGVELALRLNAEIVSLDSMAIYQGMDIGTAKPSAHDAGAQCRIILLDLVPPTEDFSLSEYIDAAHAAIAEIKRPRAGSPVCRRDAAVFEVAAPRRLSRAAGGLGVSRGDRDGVAVAAGRGAASNDCK